MQRPKTGASCTNERMNKMTSGGSSQGTLKPIKHASRLQS